VAASRLNSRPSVALTALLCLAAQVLGFAHLALVRHATCLEHAEIVHAPAAKASHALPAAPHARVDGEPAEESGHDDHCLVVASRRRESAALEDGLQISTITLTAATPLRRAPAETPAAPVPLLALAPKGSPPATV